MNKVMGIVILILGAVVGLILVVFVVGTALPAEHRVSHSRQVSATPEQVWARLSATEEQTAWRKDLKSIKLLSSEPKKWVETMSMGDVPMVLVESVPSSRMVTKIDSEDLPFGGSWTFELAPNEGGTKVTITEEGVVKNPVFRFMSRFIFGHETTMKSYLSQLQASYSSEEK